MHYIMISFSGTGGVLPLVTLGKALRERGHRVTVVAGNSYEDVCRENGAEFIALSDRSDYARSVLDKNLLATRYWALFVLRHAIDWNVKAYRILKELAAPDVTVISVDRPILWADLLAYRHLYLDVVRVQCEPPDLLPDVRLTASPLSRIQQILLNRCRVKWSKAASGLGISARSYEDFNSIRSVLPIIGLWPSCLTAGPDKVPNVVLFDYLHPPDSAKPQIDDDIASYVEKAPILFVAGTVGTTRWWCSRFFDVSVGICQRLTCSGLLLGGDSPASDSKAPESVAWRKFVPLSEILPYAKAIVHHGGIGTAFLAIKYAVPQLIIPRIGAQASNAERLRRLGVCVILPPKSYTVQGGTTAVETLLKSSDYRLRSRQIAEQNKTKDTVNDICEFLERKDYKQSASEGYQKTVLL